MEEIIVVSDNFTQQQLQGLPPPPPHTGNGPPKRFRWLNNGWVQVTAAGVPRKKPGRKPGSVVKPRNSDGNELQKARKPRKPRDPNAPPLQRKRKIAPAGETDQDVPTDSKSLAAAAANPRQPRVSDMSTISASSPSQQHQQLSQHSHQQEQQQRYSPKMPKREHFPGSMQSILNSDPPSQPKPATTLTPTTTTVPLRTSGQSYDPIRGNYDPVRETMMSHSTGPYGSATGSPRAPAQMPHRSPTIASLIEPTPPPKASPSQPHSHHAFQPTSTQPRFQAQDSSVPPSPSSRAQPASAPVLSARPPPVEEASKKPPPPPPAPVQRPVVKESNFTTIADGPVKRISPKQKPHTGVSTPKTDNLEDMQENDGRSILDFGKAKPGEEMQVPTIVLEIPIQSGETNKYVNFMRLAEDRYGWDALHPRQAANRDRKARIAAAAASLEKIESGRESGDEMSVDLSDGEASNPENGGTSNPDAQAKPKKKRNFKEDQYDVEDDFVDDSELLWEAQAAASRDGFFVYSGPLVPEAEKPAKEYVCLVLEFDCLTVLIVETATMVLPSVDAEAEEAAAEVEAQPVELALAVVADQDLGAVRSHENLASPSRKSFSGSARRPNERVWRSSPRRPRMALCCSQPHLPLQLASLVLRTQHIYIIGGILWVSILVFITQQAQMFVNDHGRQGQDPTIGGKAMGCHPFCLVLSSSIRPPRVYFCF